MRRQIMVTTLFSGDNASDRTYYYSKGDDGKTLYCEALMPAEAACKYILATQRLDEIVIICSEEANAPGDEPGPTALREGSSFFASDLKDLSRFDLLRYRLAEYAEELHAEYQDNNELISGEEQKKAIAFLRSFFGRQIRNDINNKFNRYFHLLARDRELQEAFNDDLRAWTPEADYERYKAWILHYLYHELKETNKMELLEGNEEVRIRLVPVKEGETFVFLKHMKAAFERSADINVKDGADIFLCMQNSEAPIIMDIFNLINLTKAIPNNRLEVRKIVTTTCRPTAVADEITDGTSSQYAADLLAGTTAFLNYGKAESIVRYWKQAAVDNPTIDRVVYAMRNIDTGISLCDINDIERGIRSLRALLSDRESIGGDTPIEQLFEILLECIHRDYGRLIETDEIEFIDLVRWAYRKEFWQQTLTLIESRAPRDFIEKGFYYYCDSEDRKEQVAKIFGGIYCNLKPFEKYKLDDVSHYYVKYYNRNKGSHQRHGKEYIHDYARLRAGELDSQNPNEIRACTACPDRSAVEDLLFAYYYLGDVRNATNHAVDTFDAFYEIMKDSDSSERMDVIQQSITYFLHCYDRVARLVKGREVNVIQVTAEEIAKYADEQREQTRYREI